MTDSVTLPKLLTQRETADYLQISEKWLERDRWQGATIPFVKIGRRIRYRTSDLSAFLEQQLQPAADA